MTCSRSPSQPRAGTEPIASQCSDHYAILPPSLYRYTFAAREAKVQKGPTSLSSCKMPKQGLELGPNPMLLPQSSQQTPEIAVQTEMGRMLPAAASEPAGNEGISVGHSRTTGKDI